MLRRSFLGGCAAAAVARGAALNHKERVDRALAGQEVDRPPFTHWHHFGLKTAQEHAARTLDYHRKYRTDIVKVMSDFPYPAAQGGKWYELKVVDNPFPEQIRALEMIRNGLNGSAYFVETVFNPWNVAEKLSSKEEVRRLQRVNPNALMAALDAITESEIRHARRAIALGASGVLFSVANANRAEMTVDDYAKFSRPFDLRLMKAVSQAPLTMLHMHVEPAYLAQFREFPAPVLNYSLHVSGVPIADVRRQWPSAAIAGGLDEVNYQTLTPEALRAQWQAASKAAGRKFILTPGCSVPNESSEAELEKLPRLVGA